MAHLSKKVKHVAYAKLSLFFEPCFFLSLLLSLLQQIGNCGNNKRRGRRDALTYFYYKTALCLPSGEGKRSKSSKNRHKNASV